MKEPKREGEGRSLRRDERERRSLQETKQGETKGQGKATLDLATVTAAAGLGHSRYLDRRRNVRPVAQKTSQMAVIPIDRP